MTHSMVDQHKNHKDSPLICHLLIGPPGAGKSTLAQQWLAQDPSITLVSTDAIREELFGSADKQGGWDEVSAEADRRIRESIAQGKSIIYDATNVQRAWRLEFLNKYASDSVYWVGWCLKTSEAECKNRNQQRARQVPNLVIDKAIAKLEKFPPDPGEGFIKVEEINFQTTLDLSIIAKLPQVIIERKRAILNCSRKVKYHSYSRLLDFERLVYLIVVLSQYPGVGNLRETHPHILAEALNYKPDETLPIFESELAEISEILKVKYGTVYADIDAIAANLRWLEKNKFINSPESQDELIYEEPPTNFDAVFSHRYSDWDVFRRVMEVTRYLAYAPLFKNSNSSLQADLVKQFNRYQLSFLTESSFRRDITEFFTRYGFWQQTMKKGYFLGTGILPKEDLENLDLTLKINNFLQNDPLQLASYSRFKERINYLEKKAKNFMPNLTGKEKANNALNKIDDLLEKDSYPSRIILHRQFSEEIFFHTIETYIDQAQVVLLEKRLGRGDYERDVKSKIAILPLQIVFYKIDWYLGYLVVEKGENEGLLRFERLARWSLSKDKDLQFYSEYQKYQGNKKLQFQKLCDLQKLVEVSFSPFIGRNPQEQQEVLTKGKKALKPLELWFANNIFNVVSLATQRFPELKMSPRSYSTQEERAQIFTLKPTDDPRFPNRLKAKLPPWTLEEDFDLDAWILRFAGQVKVVEPQYLAERIFQKGQAITEIYTQSKENKTTF